MGDPRFEVPARLGVRELWQEVVPGWFMIREKPVPDVLAAALSQVGESALDPSAGASLSAAGPTGSQVTVFQSPGGTFDIVLHMTASLQANSAASSAFERAAQFWESVFTDPITVNLDANFDTTDLNGNPFPANVIGSTRSETVGVDYEDVRRRLVDDASADESIVDSLPDASGQLTFNLAAGVAVLDVTDAGLSVVSNTSGNPLVEINRANALALGFTDLIGMPSQVTGGVTRDGAISFNSAFAFDFDPADGVAGGKLDFEAVALHEIGHALGFTSGVDIVDFLVDQGITTSFALPTPMDLFRLAPGQGSSFSTAARILNTGGNVPTQVFHDGRFDVGGLAGKPGVSGLQTGDIPLSTGVQEGDGNQASHFKADDITTVNVGVMDPTFSFGVAVPVSATDLRVFGLVGWDWTDNGLLGTTAASVGVDLLVTTDPTPALGGTVSELDAAVFVRLPAVHGIDAVTLSVDGDPFNTDAFTLANSAGSTANIVRADIIAPAELTTGNGNYGFSTGAPFFDTEGTKSRDFVAVAADAAAVGLLAPQSDALNDADVTSLTKVLPLAFSNFGPGESIRWRLGIDDGMPGAGMTGADLVGGTLVVEFDNGITASGLLAAVADNPAAASVTVTADHYLKADVDGAGSWTIAAGALPVLALGTYEVQALVVDSSGARATDATSGELRVVDGNTAALGNGVWHDLNGDGIQGAGEPGIANVTVRLLDLAGAVVATTTTGSDGSYFFTAVAPGSYVVEFEAAAELVFTRQDQGGDEALDSDADPGTGRTAPVVLLPGQFNTAIDAGNLRVGDMDLDGDVDFDDIDDFEQGLNDPDDYAIRFGVPAEFKGDIDRDGDQDFDDIKGFTAIINANSLQSGAEAASASDPAGVRAATTVPQISPTDERRLSDGELAAVWSQWQPWPGGDRAEAGQPDTGLPEGDLTDTHGSYTPIRMRMTLDIDDELLKKAARLTGLKGKTALVRRDLESLIASESGKRLAELGGSEKRHRPIVRRRASGK